MCLGRVISSLISRPSLPPVFDHLQYDKIKTGGGEGLHGNETGGREGLHGNETGGREGLHGNETGGREGLHGNELLPGKYIAPSQLQFLIACSMQIKSKLEPGKA